MRKNLTFTAFLPLFITFFLLTGCFSNWSGDEGNFTLTFGSSTAGSRASFLPDGVAADSLTHIVLLHNGPGPDQTRIIPPGTQTASFSVTPGRWTVTVEAYLDPNEGTLTAWGETTANINPGKNGTIPILMGSPTVTVTFDLNYVGADPLDGVPVTRGEKVARFEGFDLSRKDDSDTYWYFVDWYTNAACTNAFDFSTPITGDITLYAGWSNDAVEVIFADKGKNFVEYPDDEKVIRYIARGATIGTPPTVSRDGYVFDGWYEEDATAKFDFNTVINEDLTTLEARWVKILTIEIDPIEDVLSPIEDITIPVVVTGFEEVINKELLSLYITPVNSLTFDATNTSFDDNTLTMYFYVKAKYVGSSDFPSGSAPIAINKDTGLQGIPSNYCLSEDGEGAITIHDGQAATHPIPVTESNIKDFNTYARVDGRTRHYILAQDIDLPAPSPGESNWTPIGTASNSAFTGSFDGGENEISGLVINDGTGNVGMFGFISGQGEVKKLGLVDCNITGKSAGGIAGENRSRVQNCYVTGEINGEYAGGVVGYNNGGIVENCYATGKVNGEYAGGVVGNNYGTSSQIQNCYATATVTATATGGNSAFAGGVAGNNNGTGSQVQNCYARGSVTATNTDTGGTSYAGGVVGRNYTNGTVQNCYATGNVTATAASNYAGGVVGSNASNGTVRNCYATGNVKGVGNAFSSGGVVGNNYGTVENCVALNEDVNYEETSNSTNIGRIVGQNSNTTPGALSNNYGLSDMKKNGASNANQWAPNATGKDGADVYGPGSQTLQYNDQGFWNSTVEWDPDIWDFDTVETGDLPTLRNFNP